MMEIDAADIELSAGLAAQVMALAAALERTPSWVVENAVSDFVALQAHRLMTAAEDGDAPLPPGEDVIGWVRGLDGTEARRIQRAA